MMDMASSPRGLEMRNSPFPPPPQTPTLSAFPLSSQGGEGEPAASGGAILKAGQALDSMLDQIARSAPQAAEKIDRIKTALRGVIGEIVSKQAEPEPQPDDLMMSSSHMMSKGGY